MPTELFDMDLRAPRRDRAFALGPELFLHGRVFDDCLERIALNARTFQSCLMVGCPDLAWLERLKELSASVHVAEPGPLFANAAGGDPIIEDRWQARPGEYDLCVAIGTLDTVNDLPRALHSIRNSMKPDSLLIGAMSGGETLPRLRAAVHAADQLMGASSPHVHPRIGAAALAPLLTACGFERPVVDVDRVAVAYRSFDGLVGDLRRMGATNILKSRSRRPFTRAAKSAAATAFEAAALDGRTVEMFELLHFACWTPRQG